MAPMGSLIYSAIVSLDGCVSDERGDFSWATPDPEVHAFVNDLERPIGTYLYGRRMYKVMAPWETAGESPDDLPEVQDYGRIWRAAEKIVFSRTLAAPMTTRTRIEQEFDPDDIRMLKQRSETDISVGGPTLAAAALRARLVDEIRLFLCPLVAGSGLAALPEGDRIALALLEERRSKSGVVYVRYAVRP
jgi:dihydrofolate reductase